MSATYIEVPKNIDRLVHLAIRDLWHGPICRYDDGKPWPGFVDAADAIATWCDKHVPRELFYDRDSGVWMDAEPEWWQDEETGEWIEPEPCERHDGISAVLFGADPNRMQTALLDYIG